MKLVHAIFERGVFRPTESVDLPEGCEVDFEPHPSKATALVRSASISSRLNELRSLENGWLDGNGLAPSAAGLNWLTQIFDANYSVELPQPFAYPTAEGGVQVEWTIGDFELSLEIDLSTHRAQWHCLNLRTEADSFRDVNLADAGDWTRLVAEIRQLAEAAS